MGAEAVGKNNEPKPQFAPIIYIYTRITQNPKNKMKKMNFLNIALTIHDIRFFISIELILEQC